ncbi:hypothetical protein [Streptomyces sp. RKND-216]
MTLPLPATTAPQGWEEDLAALQLRLSEAEVDALAAPVPPPGGPP